MSGKGKLTNGGSGGGVGIIPAGSRKMVDSLKEIVSNYSDSEIYAVLKECNMDPNEAVNRLLSQDPFHEVKSKREKRKENKDSTESRPRGGSSSSRGGRGGADRFVGRGGSDSTLHGKFASSKKDNGPSTTLATGSNTNWQPTATSNVVASENKKSLAVATDHISSASHPSAGHQTAWVGVPGQVSMADIVKMGRPHNKAQNTTYANANHNHGYGTSYHATEHNFQFSNDHASKDSEVNLDPGACSTQHESNIDEWPLIEQPSASILPSNSEPVAESQPHPDSSNTAFDRINQHLLADEVPGTEDHGLSIGANHMTSGPIPNRKLEDDSGAQSVYDNDIDTYGHEDHNHSFEHGEFEDVNTSVSLAAETMQQLTIHKDQAAPPEEEGPSVVIPDHLQVQSVDCSHLSFGSFGSGINATLSGPSASAPVKDHLEEVHEDTEDPPMEHLMTRNSEYYGGETNASEGNLFHRAEVSGNYESPDSQTDSLNVDNSEVTHANQYDFPSSEAAYNKYENAQQLNVEFSQPQTSSHVQNLAAFNAMGYSNSSLPSNLLATNAHALREHDISYSIFPTQAMATKYGSSVSSVGGSSLSMPEALKNAGLSSAQPHPQQTLNASGLSTGPALPQHLNLHPYSQPTLPVGHFGNMIGYPFLPQSYTYMPSAFQQAFAGNSAYHQSLAAMHPQYKSSASVSSLPQSASVASGYGSFGNTSVIPGNFQMNTQAAPSVTSLGYDDAPISQYKDTNHLLSLQQNENSATWLHGPSSRTMSAIPGNTYYNYQGQHQQPGGFRQAQQQLSQNFGSLGHPNLYHSHAGVSLDHQQQNPRGDGSLTGAQGQPKQSQQIWQNNY